MAVSLAATVATAPLVAFHFGELALWGIPSTLLIVPVLPLFIGGSVLVVLAGVIFSEPIAIAGVLSHAIGNYMSFVANFFASLPIGPINADHWSITFVVGWYALVFFVLNRRAFFS